jgi:hypothetical protein
MRSYLRAPKLFLLTVNSLVGVMGVALIAAGAYALTSFDSFQAIVSRSALQLLIGLGVFVAGVAVVGAVASWRAIKALLIMYTTLLSVAFVVQVAAGVLLAIVSVSMNTLKDNSFLAAGLSTAEKQIQDVVDCAFALCCGFLAPPAQHPNELQCNASDTSIRVTLPYVACTALDTLDPSVLANHCAAHHDFSSALFDLVQRNMKPILGFVIGVAVTQLLCIVSACVVMVSHKPKANANNNNSANNSVQLQDLEANRTQSHTQAPGKEAPGQEAPAQTVPGQEALGQVPGQEAKEAPPQAAFYPVLPPLTRM